MNQKEIQKAQSKEKILSAASKLFCTQGFHATGVDQLMEKAGLTAGAFYAHFKSKKALLKESLQFAIRQNRSVLLHGTEGLKGRKLVETILQRYVSAVHRDHPEAGCPLPAVGAELHRHSKETSQLVSDYIEKLTEEIASHLEGTKAEKRMKALRLMSQAVGAILLSRMTKSTSLSDEILEACGKVGT